MLSMRAACRSPCTGAGIAVRQPQRRVPATAPPRHRQSIRRSGPPPARSSAHRSADQLALASERLSTVRCRELLAACMAELLKASLVGSAELADATGTSDLPAAAGTEPPSPETQLESLHASLQAAQQDAAHHIHPQHQEVWAESQWEVFQAAQSAVHGMLLDLHGEAASAGSATGALQGARCLEHGLLRAPDHAAAFLKYKKAAELGSAEGSLRCGIHFFEGTSPGGRDGAVAFDFLSQALDLAEASLAGSDGHAAAALPPLAPPSAETSVEGDVPPLLTAGEVRFSALTWLGRCYMEGAGVERSIAEAANCFARAGNAAELQELAALQRMYADVEIPSA